MYKTATTGAGPAPDTQPGRANFRARAKWQAWQAAAAEHTAAEAKAAYVALIAGFREAAEQTAAAPTADDTASTRRSLWGWGWADFSLDELVVEAIDDFLGSELGCTHCAADGAGEPPQLAAIELRRPRFPLPPAPLSAMLSAGKLDRLLHSRGCSLFDLLQGAAGRFPNPPDYVAYPRSESEIQELLAYASRHGIVVVPFGGGTSVVGGVTPPAAADRVISLDLARHFNQVTGIDATNMRVTVQAGVLGPALEAALKPHGLTLRFYPQSFEFSSVGGWLATHAGGHFSTGPTHIDDVTVAVRMVSPRGTITTSTAPYSGAGPNQAAPILGSEGSLGVITEAVLRVQPRPKHKTTKMARLPSFFAGAACVRELVQSGLAPSTCRLISPRECLMMRIGDGQSAVLIIGFESSHAGSGHLVQEQMAAALAIVQAHGGEWDDKGPAAEEDAASKDRQQPPSTEIRADAETWKNNFIQAPYLRDFLVLRGFICETFETCVSWAEFEAMHAAVEAAVLETAARLGLRALITCRFTHVYADGPAPYFTIVCTGSGDRTPQWAAIKEAASDALLRFNATITHHHAVGRDHARWFVGVGWGGGWRRGGWTGGCDDRICVLVAGFRKSGQRCSSNCWSRSGRTLTRRAS